MTKFIPIRTVDIKAANHASLNTALNDDTTDWITGCAKKVEQILPHKAQEYSVQMSAV